MRTQLRSQKEVTDRIAAEHSAPQRCLILRQWLRDEGYEQGGRCEHVTIYYHSGRCTTCGVTPD